MHNASGETAVADASQKGKRSAGTLFFGNITEWGPQARTYFEEQCVKDDNTPAWEAAAVAEHHVSKKKLGGVRKFFNTLGYKIGASVAKQSKRSETGTNGGVFIAVPKGHSSTVRDYSSKVVDKLPAMTGDDWSIVILHRRGIDFAYAAIYLECGGCTAANKKKVLELAAALKALGLPFAVAGDFNATPEEAVKWGYTAILGGSTMVPKDTVATCTSGTGRLIDFCIISSNAKLLLQNPRTVVGTPWRPHSGIAVDIISKSWVLNHNTASSTFIGSISC